MPPGMNPTPGGLEVVSRKAPGAWAGGLWGYMKGLGLLYCWVAPRPWLSERHCEWTLMAMEFIGLSGEEVHAFFMMIRFSPAK